MTDFCKGCGVPLTAEESKHYDNHCEGCEQDWFDRVGAWKDGADDPELDRFYGLPTETTH